MTKKTKETKETKEAKEAKEALREEKREKKREKKRLDSTMSEDELIQLNGYLDGVTSILEDINNITSLSHRIERRVVKISRDISRIKTEIK